MPPPFIITLACGLLVTIVAAFLSFLGSFARKYFESEKDKQSEFKEKADEISKQLTDIVLEVQKLNFKHDNLLHGMNETDEKLNLAFTKIEGIAERVSDIEKRLAVDKSKLQ